MSLLFVQDAHPLMNIPLHLLKIVYVLPLCLLNIDWKVLDSQIFFHSKITLSCTWHLVLSYFFISWTLIHLHGKADLDWECSWSSFQMFIATIHSIRARLSESGTSSHHGRFLMMTYLDLMNFWTSIYRTFIKVCLETLSDVVCDRALLNLELMLIYQLKNLQLFISNFFNIYLEILYIWYINLGMWHYSRLLWCAY